MSLYRLVFEKSCHLSVKFKSKGHWAVKKYNMDHEEIEIHRKLQLQEFKEIRNDAYKNAMIYNEKINAFHDQQMSRKIFVVGQKVLLYHTKLKFFSGKLPLLDWLLLIIFIML